MIVALFVRLNRVMSASEQVASESNVCLAHIYRL